MIERQGGDDHFLAFLDQALDPFRGLLHVGHHVAVGQHRALGQPGGAAGILQKGQVVVGQFGAGERQARTRIQRSPEIDRVGQVVPGHHFLDPLDNEIDQRRFRKAEHVAQSGGNDMLDRGIVDHLLQRMREVVHHQDRLGPGIAQLVAQLAGRIQGVGVDHGETGAQHREDGNRVLQDVGHHDRHPVALLQPGQGLQIGGQIAGMPAQGGIVDDAPHVAEGRSVTESLHRLLEDVGNRVVLVNIDLGADTRRVGFQPGFIHVLYLSWFYCSVFRPDKGL